MDLEDSEIIEKIESIFLPYMTNERRKLKETNNQFVHYTSADNAIRIINSKQLWSGKTESFNPADVHAYLIDLTKTVLDKIDNTGFIQQTSAGYERPA